MATALILAGAGVGAVQGLLANRGIRSALPADYTAISNIAESIADEIVVQSASVPGGALVDADNANMLAIVAGITASALTNRNLGSVSDGDYATIAAAICAAAKSAATIVGT